MTIAPITTDLEHETACLRIDALWNDQGGQEPEFDALVTLVDAYERKRWPLPDTLDPVDLLRHAMSDDVGHTRHELVGLLESPSRVSEILSRKRGLTLDMIRAISAAWGIPVALLTPAYRLDPEPARRMSLSKIAVTDR